MNRSVRYGVSGRKCYCNGCHQKFGGVRGFERHRKNFKCVDPGSVGLSLNENGFWLLPKPTVFSAAGALLREISP